MDRSRFAVVLTLSLMLSASTATAQFNLNKLKKAADTALDVKEEVDRFSFSEDEELELGLAISERIRARYGVVSDLEVTRYLSLVGTAVAGKSARPSLPWRWIILDSAAVNAFAAPGGYVHITRGALAAIQSEAELADVLAHEVAHITKKHTLQGLQKSMGMELAQDQTDFTAGSALFDAAADKGAQAVLVGFGQAEELEADQVGLEIASRAGYQARGLPNFLATLNQINADSSSKSGLFRSHPDTDERIKKANKKIKKDGLDGGVWVEERFQARVPYDTAAQTTGGPAVDGARGMAGTDGEEASDSEESASDESSDQSDKEKGGRFSLSGIASNTFDMGDEEESAEVTGAGAGRAVGEEADEIEEGPKEIHIVEVEITPDELAAFKREGGLR